MSVRWSVLRTGRPLTPGRFLVLVSVRGSVKGHSAAGRIRSVEKCNDLNGNKTRNLQALSIVYNVQVMPLFKNRHLSNCIACFSRRNVTEKKESEINCIFEIWSFHGNRISWRLRRLSSVPVLNIRVYVISETILFSAMRSVWSWKLGLLPKP
jgi:hypothetical protein